MFKSARPPQPEQVLNALRVIQDPDLHQDLVTLGMIRDLEITPAGAVSVRVVLTTPACPVKAKFESDVKAAIAALPGVTSVTVKMDSEVKARRAPPSTGAGGPQASSPQTIPGVEHIIAVSSGKGGVGKSTVAVNLAVSLALEGARVGIMDADVYGPNIPTMMGVTDQPKLRQDKKRGELFMPPSSHGVKVMSMGFLIQGDQPLVWRGPMLHSVVNQFCHKVDWGQLDYLIVDMPPGTGDVQLSLAQLVSVAGAVLVTTPQEVSMQDVRKAFHMFEKVRIPILGVVENMSYFQPEGSETRHYLFGQGGGKVLADRFHADLLSQIPIVQRVREGGDEGKPIVLRDPQSAVARQFRELGTAVARKVSTLAAEVGTRPTEALTIGSFN